MITTLLMLPLTIISCIRPVLTQDFILYIKNMKYYVYYALAVYFIVIIY